MNHERTLAQKALETQYVVMTRDGYFWAIGGGWSLEYPDAEKFDSLKAAKNAGRNAHGPVRDIIRGYGTDKEDVYDSFPAKGGCTCGKCQNGYHPQDRD